MIRVNTLCRVFKHQRHRIKYSDIHSKALCVFACVGPDHPELHAQVPAQVPHSAGQRHPEAALQHLQDLRVPGDRVCGCDSVSERQGESVFTLSRLPLIWLLLYFA